jgi:hypothetical protein
MVAFIPCAALADQSWVCSYTDFNQTPIITKYVLSGGVLTDDSKDGLKYKVLQNNEYSIIATYSISEVKPGQMEPSIGATTVIIGKKKLHYIVMHSPMGNNENFMPGGGQTANGDCIKN